MFATEQIPNKVSIMKWETSLNWTPFTVEHLQSIIQCLNPCNVNMGIESIFEFLSLLFLFSISGESSILNILFTAETSLFIALHQQFMIQLCVEQIKWKFIYTYRVESMFDEHRVLSIEHSGSTPVRNVNFMYTTVLLNWNPFTNAHNTYIEHWTSSSIWFEKFPSPNPGPIIDNRISWT